MNGIFEYDQAKALVSAGHEIIYLAVDLRSLRRRRKWGYESLRRDKISIEAINFPCGRIPKKILQRIGKYCLRGLFQRTIQKYGMPDIVHSHFIGLGFLSAKVLGGKGIPLVHTEHYSGMHSTSLSKNYKKMGEQTFDSMNEVIAVSQSLANSINDNFRVEAKVVPNVIDIETFFNPKRKYKEASKEYVFISVGNLMPIKRMDLLIESFELAFRNDRDVSLLIYGEGPERGKIESLIDNLSMQTQIHLMGYASREMIAEKMTESDSFVLASECETFGVVFVEAMAAGLPVIATKCGGPEDFVNDLNGILVDANNIEVLSNALVQMRHSVKKFDRNAVSTDARDRFAPNSIAQQLDIIYSECLNKHHRQKN